MVPKNAKMLKFLSGRIKTYKTIDSQEVVPYPVEILNFFNLSGLLPHALSFKIGVKVMLLRKLEAPSL